MAVVAVLAHGRHALASANAPGWWRGAWGRGGGLLDIRNTRGAWGRVQQRRAQQSTRGMQIGSAAAVDIRARAEMRVGRHRASEWAAGGSRAGPGA